MCVVHAHIQRPVRLAIAQTNRTLSSFRGAIRPRCCNLLAISRISSPSSSKTSAGVLPCSSMPKIDFPRLISGEMNL